MPHVIWTGPSQLDGSPIEVLVPVTKSKNEKTGPMLQTYIVRADMSPLQAVLDNKDDAICGNCLHRGDGMKGRSCYVNIGQGVMATWRAPRIWSADSASRHRMGNGRMVRIGSYGDPAAVPTKIWFDLIQYAAGNTGYTHQWRTCDPSLKRFCMASVDSLAEMLEAQRNGWRTFRVLKTLDTPLQHAEVICPNTTTGILCTQCKACNGSTGKKGSIVIHAHGTAAARNAFAAKAA